MCIYVLFMYAHSFVRSFIRLLQKNVYIICILVCMCVCLYVCVYQSTWYKTFENLTKSLHSFEPDMILTQNHLIWHLDMSDSQSVSQSVSQSIHQWRYSTGLFVDWLIYSADVPFSLHLHPGEPHQVSLITNSCFLFLPMKIISLCGFLLLL